MAQISKGGRVYHRGKAIGLDLRQKIIEDIIESGGDIITGFFEGSFKDIALANRVKYDSVKRIWRQFCESGGTEIRFEGRASGSKKLQQDDIDFIRFLKTSRPSITSGEIYQHVQQFGQVAGGTSISGINRALKNHMNDGRWTWKRLTQPVAEKFTPENLRYCQGFINYVYTVDPHKVLFFDESGIKLPDVAKPHYGHSLVGTPAVEIMRNMNSPTITLNLLCSLDGIIYANTVNGSSNHMTFLNFFDDSTNAMRPDGRPPYGYGDHIIMDNAAIHHFRAGQALGEWLDNIGCVLLYLPTYSPEFNPCENVFNKLKTILRRYEYRQLLRNDLHVAVHHALQQIKPSDMRGFYRFTGYINI